MTHDSLGTPPTESGHQQSCVNRIYLDMDGVLCDLIEGILALHNRLDMHGKIWNYQVGECIGLSATQMWKPVVAMGHKFWAKLKPYPWMYELVDWAKSECDEVFICSRPYDRSDEGVACGSCLYGKTEWLKKHFGKPFDDIVFTRHKYLVSKPGVVLIDDDDGHVEPFNAAGGRQVVFPQLYNGYGTGLNLENRLDCVKVQYEEIKRGLK